MMKWSDITQYLRSMSLSIGMMLLITYGMATNHPWLQPIWIVLIILAIQMVSQFVKSARSSRILDANIQDASQGKKSGTLFKASEKDVKKAKELGDISEMGMSAKMLIMLIAPLTIFIASGYILSIVIPEIERWQSYMIGFLLSMPISTILTFKMGIRPGAISVTPNSYLVVEKGIVYDRLNQPFILRFPLTEINVQKEKNFIEVEAPVEASAIPNKLRLFSKEINKLNKILQTHLVN